MAGEKILIIDDEPDVLTFLSTFLEDHGYITCIASDGEEGLSKVQSERPDLICLDILMPKKSGVKFYGEIRKNPAFKKIPVIIITALGTWKYPGLDFKRFIHSRSAVPPPEGYLEKPIDKNALLQIIGNILATRQESSLKL